MFSKEKRGLFGAPMAGGYIPGAAASPDAAPVQVAATVPSYKKPSLGNLLIGTLGDTLSQFGGGRGNYLPGLQRQQASAIEAQQAQQTRAAEYADWVRKEEYKAANPGPAADDAFTRAAKEAGIMPGTPEWAQINRQRAATLASPAPNFVSDGMGGGRWIQAPSPSLLSGGGGSGGNPPTPPTPPVGKLTPLGAGGAPSQGARTFPIR